MKRTLLDRWEEVDLVVQETIDLPPAERESYLARHYPGDAELQELALGILNSVRDAPDFEEASRELAQFLLGAVDHVDETDADPLIGSQIGPYRLLHLIGRGGMGVVYAASREDGQFRRTVALKFLRYGGASSRESIRRFQREREILARLEHPNIARLYGGGITDGGLPYIAMEYVAGEEILDYCDRKSLSIPQRLALFETVCETVQFAHAKLVIHRDLKPGNILVYDDEKGRPQVKLLDFGVGKLLEHDDASREETTLRSTPAPLTPEYAAPELLRGEQASTSVDIYALGVLLCELLCGRHPYGIDGRPRHEVIRKVLDGSPRGPHVLFAGADKAPHISELRATTPDRLRRRLRGDLDLICRKAVAPEPGFRYTTADQLAADIRRHLDGLPVEARPTSTAYRVGRFIRRHRTIAAIIVAAVCVLTTASVFYSARVSAERDRATAEAIRARMEAAKADQIKSFMLDLFAEAGPDMAGGRVVTARQMIDVAAKRLETDFADQPEIRAEMYAELGDLLTTKFREYDDGERLLSLARAEYDALPASDSLRIATIDAVLAQARYRAGDYVAADSLLRTVLAIRQRHLPDGHPTILASMGPFGHVLEARRKLDEAAEVNVATLDAARQRYGPESPEVTSALSRLADTERWRGRYHVADSLLIEALRVRRTYLSEPHALLANLMEKRGLVHLDAGNYDLALELTTASLAMRRAVYGESHPMVAKSHNRVGRVHLAREDPASAAPHFQASDTMVASILGDDKRLRLIGKSFDALRLSMQGRGEEALSMIQNIIDRSRELSEILAYDDATFLSRRGRIEMEMGKPDLAYRSFEEVYGILRRIHDRSYESANALSDLSRAHAALNRFEAAEQCLREAVRIARDTTPLDSEHRARALVELGRFLAERGRWKEAEPLLRESLQIRRRIYAPGHSRVIEVEELVAKAASEAAV